jgi:hypothetical protein
MEPSIHSIIEILSRRLPGGAKENHKLSFRITGLWLDILMYLQNTGLESDSFANLPGFMGLRKVKRKTRPCRS